MWKGTLRVCKRVFVSHHNSSLLAMVPVELQHVFEGEITDDVWVEDKKWLIVDVQQLSGQRQRTRCGGKKENHNMEPRCLLP